MRSTTNASDSLPLIFILELPPSHQVSLEVSLEVTLDMLFRHNKQKEIPKGARTSRRTRHQKKVRIFNFPESNPVTHLTGTLHVVLVPNHPEKTSRYRLASHGVTNTYKNAVQPKVTGLYN